MKNKQTGLLVLAAIVSVISLTSCRSGGSAAPVVIDEPAPTESVCTVDADCDEGFVCQEGACVEVVVPENPEAEPEPQPEPEEPVACAANDECESGRCSSETGFCVDSCPLGTFWKTPFGQVTGECGELSLTIPVPPPPPPPVDEWM